MNKIQVQGLSFSLIAIVIAFASVFLTPSNQPYAFFIMAGLIFFLGVPHGALDPVFAQKLLFIKSWKDWSKFVILYIALSIAVVCIWWQLPLVFMGSFLLLSVMHFSRDLDSKVPKITRLLYGGSMIFLPTLFHLSEMQLLFSAILNEYAGLQITSFLHFLAWPWLIAIVISICIELTKEWIFGLEIFAVAFISTLATPLIAFTVYFCGMHSLRHILRTQQYGNVSFSKLFAISILPMLGVVALVVFAWIFMPEASINTKVLQFVFVTLAALTVPHMLLVDKVSYQH